MRFESAKLWNGCFLCYQIVDKLLKFAYRWKQLEQSVSKGDYHSVSLHAVFPTGPVGLVGLRAFVGF